MHSPFYTQPGARSFGTEQERRATACGNERPTLSLGTAENGHERRRDELRAQKTA